MAASWNYTAAFLSSPLMSANDTINNYAFILEETLTALSNKTRRLWDRERIRQSMPVHTPSQLVNVASKLQRGQGIHVLALGSSITNQHGGCYPTHTPCYTEPGRHISKSQPYQEERLGWLRSFMTLLNHTFPANHSLDNAASSGMSIHGYTMSCIEELVNAPRQVDLVVIEHLTFLEPTKPSVPTAMPTATYLEQLLHKLWMALRHPLPAIMILNMNSIASSDGSQLSTEEQNKKSCIKDASICPTLCQGLFDNLPAPGIEDIEGETGTYSIAKRYGLSAFSQVGFLRGLIRDGIHTKSGLSLCELFATLYSDWVHPSYSGRLFLADLLMELIVSGLELSLSQGGSRPSLIPPLDFTTTLHSDRQCYYSSPRLPVGFKQDEASSHKFLRVIKDEGWEYLVEGQGQRARPGLVALKPGSKLWLTIPLKNFESAPQGSSPDPFLPRITEQNSSFLTRRFTIALSYLASWEHMGKVQMRCLNGFFTGSCNCSIVPRRVDAHIKDKISIPRFVELPAISSARARDCTLEIVVLPETESGEHKFKVIKLSVSGMRNISGILREIDRVHHSP